MSGRTIAIGDVHGCLASLFSLIDAIAPVREDTLITLGDLIDRGTDSSGVLKFLLTLRDRCRLIPLMGDHEEMFLDALQDVANLKKWLQCGGVETLKSYGWTPGESKRSLADWIPQSHRELLTSCRSYFETETHLFMHAGFQPELPMDEQPADVLQWRVTDGATAVPHYSGKVAIVGHTPQRSGEVLDLGFLIGIDTNCVRGGWLTALDVGSGSIWQADSFGKLRAKYQV